VNRPRASLQVARAAVGLTARLLPSPAARARYRAEFLAELHELPRAGRLRYAAGVLSQAFALRAAVGASSSVGEERAMSLDAALAGRHPGGTGDEEVPMTVPTTPAPLWRCRVFRLHRWVSRSTEDGGRYDLCSLCGQDRGPAGRGMMTTPPWPGSR
jgi:hypothetical protein